MKEMDKNQEELVKATGIRMNWGRTINKLGTEWEESWIKFLKET